MAGAAPAGAEDSHPGGLPDTCPEVLGGSPTDDLEKHTEPSDGSDVRGGDVVTVTLRWDPESFDGPLLHKVLDCVTVSGEFAAELSGQERDTPNDGSFEWQFTVPAGLPVGARICDRGFVSGPGSADDFERQKSNDVCFTVAPPAASDNDSASPAAPPQTVVANPPPVHPTAPPASTPTGPPPGSTTDSTTPPAPRTPVTTFPTPAPEPTGTATPGADQPPPVSVLASPPLTPVSPPVQSDATLPSTGASPTPLVMAGMVLCAGGAGIMAGAGRRRRVA